jgi:exonuclease SbcD
MALTLLHFADLHLGVENYGRIDPTTGLHSRVQDFTNSLATALDLAIEEEVDLVLFAGDMYKTCDPTPTHQREFARQLHRLQEASIPIVLIVGNHDAPVAFGKATSIDIFSDLQLAETYVIRRPEILSIDTKNGPVQIAGLPWPTRNILRTHDEYRELPQDEISAAIQEICAAQIDEFARAVDPAVPAVLAGHLTATDAIFSGSERTAIIGNDPSLLTSTLANPAYDYIALGHIHKYQDLNKGQHPPVVYSGSLERIDFGEEKEDKGFCLVSIEDAPTMPRGRQTAYEFIPVSARRFTTVRLQVSADEDATDRIVAACADAELTDAVVRIVYDLPSGYAVPVDLQRVRQALAAAYHIASIQPRFATVERQRRSEINEELQLGDALDRYIDNSPDLHERRQELKDHALRLERKLELGQITAENGT